MADIELVVKIDESTYYRFINGFADEDDSVLIENLFKNGTPLPKGHGRLIDADALDISGKFNGVCLSAKPLWIAENIIRCAPTIIEADKGDKE